MLLTVRRSALAAATAGRYAIRSRPATLTTTRWLTAPSTPVHSPPSTVVTPIKKNAPTGELSTGDARELRWSRMILPALEAFARVYGHCRVPQHFVVPSTSVWPPDAWGVKLGSAVNNMRTRGSFSSQTQRDADRLLAIDFVWDVTEYRWAEQILPALSAFATKFGHCDVPQSFVVPSDPAWPRKAWRLNLGSCVNNIRVHDFFCQQTERDAAQLEAIGFVWVSLEHRWSHVILPALEVFTSEHGHCDVPQAFVVPAKAPWPREAWGWKLGTSVDSMRSKGHYAAQIERDAARLEAIEFVWNSDEYHWTSRILPSLKVFHRLEGHSNVPRGFVVPSASPWPESAWGLKLGQVVDGIRQKGTYARFVNRDAERLMEVGFDV